MSETPTPLTDEQEFHRDESNAFNPVQVVSADFARTLEKRVKELEQENTELKAKVATVLRAVDKAEALNNSTPENETACNASFNEVMAQLSLEKLGKFLRDEVLSENATPYLQNLACKVLEETGL